SRARATGGPAICCLLFSPAPRLPDSPAAFLAGAGVSGGLPAQPAPRPRLRLAARAVARAGSGAERRRPVPEAICPGLAARPARLAGRGGQPRRVGLRRAPRAGPGRPRPEPAAPLGLAPARLGGLRPAERLARAGGAVLRGRRRPGHRAGTAGVPG